MGEATLDKHAKELTIHSVFFFYGDAATEELAARIAADIALHWNEPEAMTPIKKELYRVRFHIEGYYEPRLAPETVWYNDNPRNNYFRIEEQVPGDISFVDALGCNTGYFKLANLLQTSTTAAHEYGHTLGLRHPTYLDIRGKGIPGIMYPRGTLCDAHFQYDPQAKPGAPGGTLNPWYRKVLPSDIEALQLHRLSFNDKGSAVVGAFTSLYHAKQV